MANLIKLEFGYFRHLQKEHHASFTTLGLDCIQVIKKVSEVTYHIQHLYGNWQCKVVHFDQLKLCMLQRSDAISSTVRLMPAEQVANQSPCPTLQNSKGTNLELLKDYDDEIESPPISTSDSMRCYPSRVHCQVWRLC